MIWQTVRLIVSSGYGFSSQHQYDTQGGKCGICGDAYDEPQPRTHEIGGPYYKGIIVRNYAVGQVTIASLDGGSL